MSQPELPRPLYGQQRSCPHCGTRVAQKAESCFFCGAVLDSAPRRRLRLPWADLFLFAAIAGVLAIWWLHAPESPDTRQDILSTQRTITTPTVALVAALALDDPTATPQPTPMPTATAVPTDTPVPVPLTPVGPTRHKVKSGDTVSAIATLYGSTIGEIVAANGLSADARLSIGQELLIPVAGGFGGAGPTTTPGPAGLMVTVKSGDTLSGLAERYQSRLDWILQANGMQPGETLHIGRALLIPLIPATPTPTPTVPITPLPDAPTPTPGLAAPQLLTPGDAAIIAGEESVLLSWTSVGVLGPEEWYVATLMSPEKATPIFSWWTKSTSWRLPAEYRPTGSAGVDYTWRVQVRKGSADQPGDTVSPPSAGRRFTWR
jgi:LysM repeat protein